MNISFFILICKDISKNNFLDIVLLNKNFPVQYKFLLIYFKKIQQNKTGYKFNIAGLKCITKQVTSLFFYAAYVVALCVRGSKPTAAVVEILSPAESG